MITILCFEGAGASSSSGGPRVFDVVCEQARKSIKRHLESIEVASCGFKSRRKHTQSIRGTVARLELGDPLICVGKSAGAVRMFAALKRAGVVPFAIVSIDPLTAGRMIFGHDVKTTPELAERTINIVADGVDVRGATNWRAIGYNHMSVISSPVVQSAIRNAINAAADTDGKP